MSVWITCHGAAEAPRALEYRVSNDGETNSERLTRR
jgi:hypothetical protein